MALTASALVALAVWPSFASRAVANADPTAQMTPAPLRDDELVRAKTIAFEEVRETRDPHDQITPRMLSGEYLQRYREHGDVGDILRAQASAERSLRAQPYGNAPALSALAGSLLALHRFRESLATIREARRESPDNPSLAMSEASLELELGNITGARALIAHAGVPSEATESISSRLAELTGDLPRARMLLGRASRRLDAIYGIPNERRAWMHTRLGELAFEAGDIDAALAEEHTALERFSEDALAFTDTARFSAADGRWSDARAAAQAAVDQIPSPENLGLLADAQQQLGDDRSAAATRDEVVAVERIGNSQHLLDRLLALYYADHGIRLDDAYQIAKRDLAIRDDVFGEDAVAWTAARSGRWAVARAAARKSTAWNTADPRIWYHAGVIAQHDGNRTAALADYRHALGLNPHFQAVFADDARRRVAALTGSGT